VVIGVQIRKASELCFEVIRRQPLQ